MLGQDEGEQLSAYVIDSDGTEADLAEHLNSVHGKGTKGLTDEYLATLHQALHQRTGERLPEHTHPGDDVPPVLGDEVPAAML
jgi:hypothetical protein